MLIRSTMAVLDFNHNVQRKTKTGKDGEPMYKMKVRLYCQAQPKLQVQLEAELALFSLDTR